MCYKKSTKKYLEDQRKACVEKSIREAKQEAINREKRINGYPVRR